MPDTFDSNHSDQSVHGKNGVPSKRRRIALACQDCRRRKLSCDRAYPACGRCLKGGHAATCTYHPDAIEAMSNGEGSAPNGSRNVIVTTNAQQTLATPSPSVHHQQVENDDNLIGRMQFRISQLESRLNSVERVANAGLKCTPIASRSSIKINGHYGVDASAELHPEEKEFVMFRGRNFKSSFYGASHHTSYLSQVIMTFSLFPRSKLY